MDLLTIYGPPTGTRYDDPADIFGVVAQPSGKRRGRITGVSPYCHPADNAGERWSDDDIKIAVFLHDRGVTDREIGKIIGRTRDAVYMQRHLVRQGVKRVAA